VVKLGIHPKRISALNDTEGLRNLTDNIKQTFYQDYKTCYSEDDNIGEDCRGSFK
jgi:hypothetical protein